MFVLNQNQLKNLEMDFSISHEAVTEIIHTSNIQLGEEINLPWTAESLLSATFEEHGNDLWIMAGARQLILNDWATLEKGLSWISSDGHKLDGKVIADFIQPENIALTALSTYSDAVATVQEVKGNAWAIDENGVKSELLIGDKIPQGTVVETGINGFIKLSLADSSLLTLGSEGKYVINDFSFDSESQAGVTLMSILKGAFSFISGLIARENPENVRIFTPTAEIGIRGTKLIGEVSADGETEVMLIEGRIIVASNSETFQIVLPLNGVQISKSGASLIRLSSISEIISIYGKAIPREQASEFFEKELDLSIISSLVGADKIANSLLPNGFTVESSNRESVISQKLFKIVESNSIPTDITGFNKDVYSPFKKIAEYDVRETGEITTQKHLVAKTTDIFNKLDTISFADSSGARKVYLPEKMSSNKTYVENYNIQVNGDLLDIIFYISSTNSFARIGQIQKTIKYTIGTYKYEIQNLQSESQEFQNSIYISDADDVYIFVGLASLKEASFKTSTIDFNPLTVLETHVFLITLVESDIKQNNPSEISKEILIGYNNLISGSNVQDTPDIIVFYNYAPIDNLVVLENHQSVIEGKPGLIDKYVLVLNYDNENKNSINRICDADLHVSELKIKYFIPKNAENKLLPILEDRLESNIISIDKFVIDINIDNSINPPVIGNELSQSNKIVIKFSFDLSVLLLNSAQNAKSGSFVFEINLSGDLQTAQSKYELFLTSENNLFKNVVIQEKSFESGNEFKSMIEIEDVNGNLYDVLLVVNNDSIINIDNFILVAG